MRTLDVSMLDRIVVDVIDVCPQIIGIADRVLPEPPLPYAAAALTHAGSGAGLFRVASGQIRRG